jgi:hypothetical protein
VPSQNQKTSLGCLVLMVQILFIYNHHDKPKIVTDSIYYNPDKQPQIEE